MRLTGFRRKSVLYLAAIGAAVWPITWIYLLRDAKTLQHPQLWQDFLSPGYILMVVAAAIGTCSLAVYIIVAREKDENRDNPAAFHGTARFANKSEIDQLRLSTAEQLPPGSFILGPDRQGGIIALPRSRTVQHGLILGG